MRILIVKSFTLTSKNSLCDKGPKEENLNQSTDFYKALLTKCLHQVYFHLKNFI